MTTPPTILSSMLPGPIPSSPAATEPTNGKPKSYRSYEIITWIQIIRNHSCYNSYEVGQRLALTMLTKLDPTAEPWTDPAHDLDPDLLPIYNQYKAQAAYLPGMSSVYECTMNALISTINRRISLSTCVHPKGKNRGLHRSRRGRGKYKLHPRLSTLFYSLSSAQIQRMDTCAFV